MLKFRKKKKKPDEKESYAEETNPIDKPEKKSISESNDEGEEQKISSSDPVIEKAVDVQMKHPTSKNERTQSSSQNPESQNKASQSSWLTRTKTFKRISDWAFDSVDIDGSGCVDEKELYSGLLLIHLNLGVYAGPAACKPVDRDRVHDIFLKKDIDNNGSLDKAEFLEVMAVLCGNILTRVAVQWASTIIIVPMVAQALLDGIVWLVGLIWVKAPVSLINTITEFALGLLPDILLYVGNNIKYLLDLIPDSIWDCIPLTIISCVLACVAVPYVIFKIDDFFQSLANDKEEEKKNQ